MLEGLEAVRHPRSEPCLHRVSDGWTFQTFTPHYGTMALKDNFSETSIYDMLQYNLPLRAWNGHIYH